MFPLDTVLFPGMRLPLHIFEPRYRALIKDLLARPDPQQRRFGIVAIREGYEVGNRGLHSAHRVGCVAQIVATHERSDGRYDIQVAGRRRFRVESLAPSGAYLEAEVTYLPEPLGPAPHDRAGRAAAVFEAYRRALAKHGGSAVVEGPLPAHPVALSYSLSAAVVLTLRDRQQLLETLQAADRLDRITRLTLDELAAMRAIPSLPATRVGRTGWSPN